MGQGPLCSKLTSKSQPNCSLTTIPKPEKSNTQKARDSPSNSHPECMGQKNLNFYLPLRKSSQQVAPKCRNSRSEVLKVSYFSTIAEPKNNQRPETQPTHRRASSSSERRRGTGAAGRGPGDSPGMLRLGLEGALARASDFAKEMARCLDLLRPDGYFYIAPYEENPKEGPWLVETCWVQNL